MALTNEVPSNERQYMWKDLSGRGFVETISQEAVLEAAREEEDAEMEEWAESCDVGDEYTEDPANFYMRIK